MLLHLILLCFLAHFYKCSEQLPRFDILQKLYGIRHPTAKNSKAILPQWGNFTVKLDHHNPFDRRTFEMRYLNSSVFFKERGPIFIFLGGEWEIDPSLLMTGQMFDLAFDHNGYMFYTEHRYYGKSHPTEDYSLENLKFLTTDQALEDVANFIGYQKSLDMFKDSKVVVVGCSYSGAMATWLRLKYPHLVDIAYSSSAPLLAKTDFYEYLEVVNDAIGQTDIECLNIIEAGISKILENLKSARGRKKITDLFSLCRGLCDRNRDLTGTFEKAYFFANIIWSWSGIVQHATDGDIQRYCNVIHKEPGDPVKKLAAFMKSYSSYCLPSYANFVQYFSNTSPYTGEVRQWIYQTCTEYGFFHTTNSDKQPFSNTLPMEFFYQLCFDFFGSNFTSDILNTRVNRTNLLYGQLEPEVTKVISVHGTIDPWHRLGVLKDLNELAPAIIIKGASHCGDLRSADPMHDSSEMYAAKVMIKLLIAEWLSGTKPEPATTAAAESLETTIYPITNITCPVSSGNNLKAEKCLVTLLPVLIALLIIK